MATAKPRTSVEANSSQSKLIAAVKETSKHQAELLAAFQTNSDADRAFKREVSDTLKDVSTAMRAVAAFTVDSGAARKTRSQAKQVEAEQDNLSASEEQVSAPKTEEPKSPETHNMKGTYRSHRQAGLHGVRHDVLGALSKKLAQYPKDDFHEVQVPMDHPAEVGSIMKFDEIPQVAEGMVAKTLHRNRTTGEIVTEETFNKGLRKVAHGQNARGVVNHFAEGGTLEEGIGKMLPAVGKTLGVAGAAVGVANEIQEKLQQQAERNRPFQAVLGGANSEGYGERLRQNLFRIKNKFSFNPLSDRESEAIYQGSMELYAGDRHMRGVAQSQAVGLLRNLGMDPNETMKLFKTAAKAGTEGISQISDSLRDVTKAARTAGMNAKEAREKFSDAYESISKSVAGASGILIASAQAQVITSMGHQFQGVNFDNGLQQDLMTSMQTGQSLGQIAADKNTTGGAVRYLQSQRQRRLSAIQSSSWGGQASKIVNDYLAEHNIKPGEEVSDQVQQDLANKLMSETGIDPSLIASTLSTLGGVQGLNRDNAAKFAIKEMLPGGDQTIDKAKEQISKYSDESVGDLPKDWSNPKQVSKWLQDNLGYSSSGAMDLFNHLKDGGSGGVSGKDRAAWLYIQQIRKGAKRSPIMERLIREYDGGRRYKVKSAGGKEHTVGNFELITGGFLDQVSQGQVEVVKGEGAGGSLADLVGVNATDLPGYGTEAESTSQEYKGKNFDKDEADNAHGGTIIVKAAPELSRWIQMQGVDGTVVTTEGYPASGTSSPATYPTGN